MAGHCPEKDKTVKDKIEKETDAAREQVVYEWQDLLGALRDVIDGGLNAAGKIASYAEEWDAIENVREFVYDWLAGRRAYVKVSDLLVALGVILSAIEIELGIDSAELLEPLRAMLDVPSRLPAFIHLPGADATEKPTVVIRRFPRRRNASSASAFVPLAA
jgi:hypothetical protein